MYRRIYSHIDTTCITSAAFLSGRKAIVWSRDYSNEDVNQCDCDALKRFRHFIIKKRLGLFKVFIEQYLQQPKF
jgi:hypothetical protein